MAIGIGIGTAFAQKIKSYPLDGINAAAAFFLRKPYSGFSGNLIKIRRSSDNTEQDFGLKGDILDIDAIDSFLDNGTDIGYVTTMYDVTGNNNHLLQSNTDYQPRIIYPGKVDNVFYNGFMTNSLWDSPSILFQQSDINKYQYIASAATLSNVQNFALNLVSTPMNEQNNLYQLLCGSLESDITFDRGFSIAINVFNNNGKTLIRCANNGTVIQSNNTIPVSAKLADLNVFSGIKDGNLLSFWHNSKLLTDKLLTGGISLPESMGINISGKAQISYAAWQMVKEMVLLDSADYNALSKIQANQANEYMTNKPIIMCDGNSITHGYQNAYSLPYGAEYPAQLQSLLGKSAKVINRGRDGRTTANQITDATTYVDPSYDSSKNCILVAWEGINSMAASVGNLDATTAYNQLVSYCNARKAVGWTVLVGTCLPSVALDTQRKDDYNALIRANWQDFADGLIDFAADTTMGNDSTVYNTTYYRDGTHPAAAGYTIIANIAMNAIAMIV